MTRAMEMPASANGRRRSCHIETSDSLVLDAFLEVEFLHFVPQRVPADIEKLGGSRLVSSSSGQGLTHQLLFHPFQRRALVRDGELGQLGGRWCSGDPRAWVDGQCGCIYLRTVSQNHRSLDEVLQLANVARPVVFHQHRLRFRREPFDLLAELPVVMLYVVARQKLDIGTSVPQRWQIDGDDVEAIEEVLSELPLVDHRL